MGAQPEPLASAGEGVPERTQIVLGETVIDMAIHVETRDCTALTDADLAEQADLAAAGTVFDIGQLSKAKEAWVLATTARCDEKLHGYMYSTLERIGGTPCVLLGLVAVKRSSKRDAVLKALMHEAYHRALMAFPDEDVLVGTRLVSPAGFEAFKQLDDIVPRPGHKAVGEERAWGRRLAKRFQVDGFDEQTFQVKGGGSYSPHIDHESLKTEPSELAPLFKGVKPAKGDCLIAFGWVMAEDLVKLGA